MPLAYQRLNGKWACNDAASLLVWEFFLKFPALLVKPFAPSWLRDPSTAGPAGAGAAGGGLLGDDQGRDAGRGGVLELQRYLPPPPPPAPFPIFVGEYKELKLPENYLQFSSSRPAKL